jgi:hypothetical protein
MTPEDLALLKPSEVTQIQVIRAEELNPGDIVLIKAKYEDMNQVSQWADRFFHPFRCHVGVILDTMSVQVITPDEEVKHAVDSTANGGEVSDG